MSKYTPKRTKGQCPHCGRVEGSDNVNDSQRGHWYKPCPSEDCPSRTARSALAKAGLDGKG